MAFLPCHTAQLETSCTIVPQLLTANKLKLRPVASFCKRLFQVFCPEVSDCKQGLRCQPFRRAHFTVWNTSMFHWNSQARRVFAILFWSAQVLSVCFHQAYFFVQPAELHCGVPQGSSLLSSALYDIYSALAFLLPGIIAMQMFHRAIYHFPLTLLQQSICCLGVDPHWELDYPTNCSELKGQGTFSWLPASGGRRRSQGSLLFLWVIINKTH